MLGRQMLETHALEAIRRLASRDLSNGIAQIAQAVERQVVILHPQAIWQHRPRRQMHRTEIQLQHALAIGASEMVMML